MFKYKEIIPKLSMFQSIQGLKKMILRRYIEDTKPQGNVILLKSEIDSCTFHVAIKFSIQLAQVLSYFPINIGVSSYNSLKFKWLHWRVAYALVTFLFYLLELFLHICYHFRLDVEQDNMLFVTIMVFHVGAVAQYILFFKLTLEWPTFVKEWHRVEIRMKNYEIHCSLRKQLNYITSSVMIIAGVEHALVNAYKLVRCLKSEATTDEALKVFFVKSYVHIFNLMEYSLWKGLIAQFLNLQRTFNWSYADVLVMIIGAAFKFRLKLMTKKLHKLSRLRVNDVNLFRSVRKDYVKLSELCETINNRMSYIIIVCYSLNIYFILAQLFNSFKKIESTIEKIYFYLSFCLLLIRITCVCIFGGGVYEEWKNIGSALFSVQSAAYNIEVQRFIDHVITYQLILTGKNFFSLSRGLILKISGAIVTYELVLLQFNAEALKSANS